MASRPLPLQIGLHPRIIIIHIFNAVSTFLIGRLRGTRTHYSRIKSPMPIHFSLQPLFGADDWN